MILKYTSFLILAVFLTCSLGAQPAFSAAAKKEQEKDENGNNLFSAFGKKDKDKEEEGTAAINQYSKKYRKNFDGWSTRAALLPQEKFELYFVNTDISDDAVILRMTSPALVSGCANIKQPAYQAIEQGQILWIKVDGPGVELKKDPRYGNGDCKTSSQNVSLDIPLSRAKIQTAPIRKLALKSVNHTDYYDVVMQGEKLTLVPQTSVAFKPRLMQDGSDSLTHWFFPQNTVVLFMPGARTGDDFTYEVEQLAYTQGLVPLKSMMPDFTSPQPNVFYFVDQSGFYSQSISGETKSVFFGRILAEREMNRANAKQSELDVYARTPYLPG